MSMPSLRDHDQEMPSPSGHAIGFVNSRGECDAVTQALIDGGFPESAILVLSGDDGVHLLKRMMGGSLWGETAEDVVKEGVVELTHGHFVLVISTKDRNEAMIAANLATRYGGHGFNHFGVLADERLTK